jgi:hypothetical protein
MRQNADTDGAAAAVPDAVCAAAGLAAQVDVLCAPLTAGGLTISVVKDVVHHAAIPNGCMCFEPPRGIDSVYVEVRADHSSTCHSMGLVS